MANLNRIILVGKLTADPDSRNTVEGFPVAKFTLAVDRPTLGQGEAATELIDVVAWRRLAEVASQHLKKGQMVLVEGRIQNRSFEDQAGQRRWATEVVAQNLKLFAAHEAAVSSAPVAAADAEEAVDDTDLAGDLPF